MNHHFVTASIAVFVTLAVGINQRCSAEISLTALRQQAGDQLRLEATADNLSAKRDAATALCDLYVVLRSDSRYRSSEMLRGTAAKVRRRLISIAKENQRRLERAEVARPPKLGLDVDAALQDSLSPDHSETTPVGAEAGGAAPNAGWRLVELIERIVAPDFWESVGGPGSIRYFAMRRILVVRATSDVHQQVKDLLTALR